jgi:PHP family Zn ribbon phosphoesterase
MSPHNILERASQRGLDIIGIADHNSTLQSRIIADIANQYNIFVLCGAEVTSVEEAHCLCFFPENSLDSFQEYLDRHILKIPNNPDKLGYQVMVDEQEQIIKQVSHSLLSALDQSVEDICNKTHELGGIFIPAHINRPTFSLFSQLGFVPDELNEDALEISWHISREKILEEHPELHQKIFIQSSDAHYLDDIGKAHSLFKIQEKSLEEIKMALHKQGERNVYV